MTKQKCFIIDEMFPNITQLLQEIGIDPVYKPDITREQIIAEIYDYEGLIVRSKTPIDSGLLEYAKKLHFIARAGAGIDNIDEAYCKERGITVFNAPEANCNAVGEHAVGMLLSLFNKINSGDREVRNGIWDREGNRGTEIQGRTVGIIGFGNMGSAFARRLRGFDCRVIAYDKYKTGFGDEFVQEVNATALYQQTDILSLHIPLTEETSRMVNINFLRKFRKGITLINTARGKIVVLRDLLTALGEGKVLNAALDVLENEKIKKLNPEEQSDFDQLIQKPNVLLTPHVGGWSFESYEKINGILVEKINEFLKRALWV